MAWASARCKPQARRRASQRVAVLRTAAPRLANHRRGPTGPLNPTQSPWFSGGLTHHRTCASRRYAMRRPAPHRQPQAPVTGGTPPPAAGA